MTQSSHVLHGETIDTSSCSTVSVSHILNHIQNDTSQGMTTATDKKKPMGTSVSHQNTFIYVSIFLTKKLGILV